MIRLPRVVLNHPELGSPEGYGRKSWSPVPGSHLWRGGMIPYLWLHIRESFVPVALVLAGAAVAVAVALAPLWL